MALMAFVVYIDQLEEDADPAAVKEVVQTVVQQEYPYHDVTVEMAEDL